MSYTFIILYHGSLNSYRNPITPCPVGILMSRCQKIIGAFFFLYSCNNVRKLMRTFILHSRTLFIMDHYSSASMAYYEVIKLFQFNFMIIVLSPKFVINILPLNDWLNNFLSSISSQTRPKLLIFLLIFQS